MSRSTSSDGLDAASKAFSRARREALTRLAWAAARNRRGSVTLASFEEAKSGIGRSRKVLLGIRRVRLEDIAGSLARSADFDDRFLPLKRDLCTRWKAVYRSLQQAESLGLDIQPVSLYRIDRSYFVRDGNHRVSVARFRGWDAIEAEVVLLAPAVYDHST